MTLRVRWLGKVPYREALAVQEAMFGHGVEDHLLLLEHPHVFTHGPRADLAATCSSTRLRSGPISCGRTAAATSPITARANSSATRSSTSPMCHRRDADHVCAIEQLLIVAASPISGVADAGCLDDYPGVWVGVSGPNPRKICAIGVRLARGRTMHGFALNVDPDLRVHARPHRAVRHPRQAGHVAGRGGHRRDAGRRRRRRRRARRRAAGATARSSAKTSPGSTVPTTCRLLAAARAPVRVRCARRLAQAGVADGLAIVDPQARLAAPQGRARSRGARPEEDGARASGWSPCARRRAARTSASAGPTARPRSWCSASAARARAGSASSTPASRWRRRRRRARRVAEAVARMGLAHAVLTMVARDDLPDGGMAHVARVRRGDPSTRCPGTRVETLIPDCKGDADVAAAAVRRSARRAEPQHRDRRPPAARGAAVGRRTPAACRCWPGPRRPG